MSPRRSTPPIIVCAVLFVCPVPGTTQQRLTAAEQRWVGANWVDDASFLALNALVTGLASGVVAEIRGTSGFRHALVQGLLGGSIAFAGKRLAAERFRGAGLAGRQVAAVGASIARNGQLGRSPLAELVLPGPGVWLYWDRSSSSVLVRPDLTTLFWTAFGLVREEFRLDLGMSLSTGAPVFVADDHRFEDGINGFVEGRVMFLSRLGSSPLGDVRAHESVHVIQSDLSWTVWALPLETWLLSKNGLGRWISERSNLGVTAGLPQQVGPWLWPRERNPFEVEAEFLEIRAMGRVPQ
jgi:hypothetical protein